MSTSVNCGYPLFVDGAFYTAANWRAYESGTAVQDSGTAAAVSPAGGVFGTTQLAVAPGTGLTVTVAAGYCCVPSTTGSGAYRFGLMAQATLTVASNSSGSARQDYVIANVQDLGTTSSSSQVEYLTGSSTPPSVPSNSIVLAQIAVPNGASNLTTGAITDKRTQVVGPGGIIPISSLGAAPTVPSGQLMYLAGTGLIYSPYTVVTETLTGSGTWTCPHGTSHVRTQVWAGGAGGTSPGGAGNGAGGGAGEYAEEPSLAVAAGVGYAYSAGAGGQGGTSSTNVENGTDSSFAGASVTVYAHGGQVTAGSQAGGTGGTGSTNTIHFPGGGGGGGDTNNDGYGGGGGAAGSPAGTGAVGSPATTSSNGSGGFGQGGGGSGGDGGAQGYGGGWWGRGGGTTAEAGADPGGGGGGAGGSGTNGGAGGDGYITLTYVVAPGPSAYPVAGSANYWYGYEGAATTFTSTGLQIEADGVSDYKITVQAASATSTGFNRVGQLAILADGTQLDAINLAPTSSSEPDPCGWTYYTSGAQGTTLPAGVHTITLQGSHAQMTGPSWIRVDQVLA